jgi:S1-C subfamily serine protease
MKHFLIAFGAIIGLLSGCNSNTQQELQRDLGFRHGTPLYTVNGAHTEVMDVSTVKPGGAFAKAGFKTGDIFLDLRERHSISELYQLLENSRGKTITLRVVPGGNGPPLEQRPVRSIRLKVPSRV